ncbi:Malonate decarboxylase holo-[acyl-carrier protein] synthase [Paenibacillus nuruki]|uniref:Malonate decarboxylase holo-[acyl-carrier protein] synthase n=1 Tax=Paenibacillus nuruki TaxID=1886670 RepID=A0A1E3KZ35_9BACL|nr:malonate decarboxylase holo-ACP synthase [Paenibacillus nuruki]ODP26797.1 Malonate decarboxylase holo-[acyl-carrier protein] synthase [Paenibacillus nuruki]
MGLSIAPHDLLQLNSRWREVEADHDLPEWVLRSLEHTPWVVVRRAPALEGQIAVGVRGKERHLRQALTIPDHLVVQQVTPEQLLQSSLSPDHRSIAKERWHTMPALQVLEQLAVSWKSYDLHWGPAGSTGFELATGMPTLTMTSDLDIVLRCTSFLAPVLAEQLLEQTLDLPVRVDVQIETPYGAVALSEWARPATDQVLMRTLQGPLLVTDPWNPRLV